MSNGKEKKGGGGRKEEEEEEEEERRKKTDRYRKEPVVPLAPPARDVII